jgi:hypothetical protein
MILLAVSTSLVTAALFFPALRMSRPGRMVVLGLLVLVILLTPRLIPLHRFARFLASAFAVALVVKLDDLHVGADLGHRPSLRAFLAFLPNPTSVVLRRLDDEPRPSRREDLLRLAKAGAAAVAGATVLIAAFLVDWRRWPFAVEHVAKVVAFFLMLVPTGAAGAAVWRLFGGRAREPMDNPFFASTPADFWRRYNRPAQQFFAEDVFKLLGGLRAPVRATLATFAVSAVIHEYVFGIAIGRVQGYQTAFFLLQGVAVVATMRIRPKGWRQVPWIAATLAFNLASSTLFFASLDEVVPFYARRSAGD